MGATQDKFRRKMILGQDGNALLQLLVINAVIFVILKFILVVYQAGQLDIGAYYKNVYNWFVLPASLGKLVTRPWTLLSYMFADEHLFQFIANLFWLWSFGYILQDLTGNRKLAAIYVYGGLSAAVFYIASSYIFPGAYSHIDTASFAGANAAILAIAVATTTVAPDYRIFPMINGGFPLWVLTLVFVLINFSTIPYSDTGAYMGNLAAAGMGFLFIYQMRRGRDWSAWMNQFFDWCYDLFNPDRKKKIKSTKDDFFYKVSGTQPYKKIPNITQKRIDAVLDKINQQGYRFLTDEEKDILKRASEEEDL